MIFGKSRVLQSISMILTSILTSRLAVSEIPTGSMKLAKQLYRKPLSHFLNLPILRMPSAMQSLLEGIVTRWLVSLVLLQEHIMGSRRISQKKPLATLILCSVVSTINLSKSSDFLKFYKAPVKQDHLWMALLFCFANVA